MNRIVSLVLWASITLAQSLFAQPVVSAVLDGAAYTNNIAPGTVFVVKGTALSAAGNVGATTIPYPSTLNNVRMTLADRNGRAVLSPSMIYAYNLGGVNQLGALLHSSAAVGAYDLRVESATATSAEFRTSGVARNLGIVTASGDSKGQAEANLEGKLIPQRPTKQGKLGDFETRSARQGERDDLWRTALGADWASDNGGTPGDWVELFNPGPRALGGFVFKDNDDMRNHILPATTVPAGGYYMLDKEAFGFGLGAADQARLYHPDGTLAASYIWSAQTAVTYERSPIATGPLSSNSTSTKAAANDWGSPVRINEVDSEGGSPGDWVELYNPTSAPLDVSNFVLRDSVDANAYTLPAGSIIAPQGYLVLEAAAFTFDLGASDSVRLFDAAGTLADSYSWTAHAATTFGRCPNGSGDFSSTTSPTKGAVNACAGDFSFTPWPGAATVENAGPVGVFNGNLSGLIYEPSGGPTPGVIWAARNGPGSLFRLTFNGAIWTPDTANSWATGKQLRYPNGSGDPDAEGVTFAGNSSSGGLYVSTERDNRVSGVSRLSILRFDPAATGSVLTATHEWNLTADLPAAGPNLGLEAITWVPDSYLTSRKFFDESKNRTYNPADYPNHGTGIFFVGVEAGGIVYAYALDQTGTNFTRLATIPTGLAGVMDLQFDGDQNDLWAVCDDTCQGRSVVFRIDSTGKFTPARRFERPTGMPNLNNEGFAIAPASLCTSNGKPVFWADDGETGGHAIRRGTLNCSPL